ncbi:MAG: carbohydrate ABC transporter permease [Pseudobdellovibrionaceae bacterium]
MKPFISRGQRYQLLNKFKIFLLSFLVIIIIAFSILPFYWAIVSSLRSGSHLFETTLWPQKMVFENYITIFKDQPFGRNILNSLFVAISTVLFSLTLAVPASFALGRVEFKGRKCLLMTILSISMFPQVAVLSGMFELITSMGLYDNKLGLVFSYTIFTLPFTVWVLTTFMKQLPQELEEAAIIDGAGPITIIYKVFLPLLSPVLVTTGLLAFIAAWNEFLFALTFTLSNETRTVPVAIAMITGGNSYELPWGLIMAASVTVTLPLVLMVIIFQKRIVSGLTAGAVKG